MGGGGGGVRGRGPTAVCDARPAEVEFDQLAAANQTPSHHRVTDPRGGEPQDLKTHFRSVVKPNNEGGAGKGRSYLEVAQVGGGVTWRWGR